MEPDSNALILIGIVTFLIFYLTNLRRNKLLVKIPSPPALPFIGHTLYFAATKKEDLLNMLEGLCNKYGSAVATWSFGETSVILSDPKHLENLLAGTTHIKKGYEYDFLTSWLGDGLLVSIDQKWQQRRKMLTPSFHFKILEDFLPIMNQAGQKMVEILKRKYGDGQKSFDIMAYATRCTLDIICETAMGKPINAQENEKLEYSEAIVEFGEFMMERAYKPWYRIDIFWRLSPHYKRYKRTLEIMHGLTNSVIKEKKVLRYAARQNYSPDNVQKQDENEDEFGKSKKKKAFLDLILDVQENVGEKVISDVDIRDETNTFMFAGHDTTSTSISFTMFLLGNHPDIQDKVRQELTDVFGNDKERPVTPENLSKLKYLECVLKESLRIFSPVPMVQRRLRSDMEIGDGIIVPKNATVAVFIYRIHRDPKYYPDPLVFRPERWMEPMPNKHSYSFIPFSAGPRNCIGQRFALMEAKTLLAILLRNFKVQSMQTPEELRLAGELTLRSLDGLNVKVTAI